MSWNINTKGTPKNVASVIQADQCMPDSLKAGIIEAINANTGPDPRVIVETSGHVGYGSGYVNLSIRNWEPAEAPEIPEPGPAEAAPVTEEVAASTEAPASTDENTGSSSSPDGTTDDIPE